MLHGTAFQTFPAFRMCEESLGAVAAMLGTSNADVLPLAPDRTHDWRRCSAVYVHGVRAVNLGIGSDGDPPPLPSQGGGLLYSPDGWISVRARTFAGDARARPRRPHIRPPLICASMSTNDSYVIRADKYAYKRCCVLNADVLELAATVARTRCCC